ncbi:hypothetical protein THRCLA_09990 [Thraustotheca clavata]|uniref:Methyltransferase domain-containing protein n=1 Tax=Thraustotheca clavata TaxID=74557 RepID=A0A1V9YT80_9STRA|nr:hypothetical protein THRCLA_09990 [Thraustotheca clavata]
MVQELCTLEEWRASDLVLLDVREEDECSFVLACDRVVHIPWSQQKARSHEYPSRNTAFGVLCPRSYAKAMEQIEWLTSETIHTRQLPWRLLSFYIVDSKDVQEEAIILGLTEKEKKMYPHPRLWSPNALLYSLVPIVIATKTPLDCAIVDLGCGSGRDIMYFAEEMIAKDKKMRYIGVDHNRNGRKKALDFASRRGIGDAFSFVKMDLNEPELLLNHSFGQVQCFFGCRYLNRSLFPVVQTLLPPNGIFGWMHFCMPPDGSEWRWQHPSKSADILQNRELYELFKSTFEILVDLIEYDTDHGRPMNLFIARKHDHERIDEGHN